MSRDKNYLLGELVNKNGILQLFGDRELLERSIRLMYQNCEQQT